MYNPFKSGENGLIVSLILGLVFQHKEVYALDEVMDVMNARRSALEVVVGLLGVGGAESDLFGQQVLCGHHILPPGTSRFGGGEL